MDIRDRIESRKTLLMLGFFNRLSIVLMAMGALGLAVASIISFFGGIGRMMLATACISLCLSLVAIYLQLLITSIARNDKITG